MFGTGAGEDVGASPPRTPVAASSILSRSSPVSTHVRIRQADLPRRSRGGAGMIAGDHLHANTCTGHSATARPLPRVADRSDRPAQEGQPALDAQFSSCARPGFRATAAQRQHAAGPAAPAHLARRCRCVGFDVACTWQHPLRRALSHGSGARTPLMQRRHEAVARCRRESRRDAAVRACRSTPALRRMPAGSLHRVAFHDPHAVLLAQSLRRCKGRPPGPALRAG